MIASALNSGERLWVLLLIDILLWIKRRPVPPTVAGKSNPGVTAIVAQPDAVDYIRAHLEFRRTLYLRAQAPAMLAMAETFSL